MKHKYRTGTGFTLIELLVVVLIIGILAAVALPLYNKSVEKSRAAEGMTIVSTLAKAGKMYIMETGSSPMKWSDLDIQYNVVPDVKAMYNQIIGSGNWYCGFSAVYARCARKNGNISYAFYYYFDGVKNNLVLCDGYTAGGQAVCKSLGLPSSGCPCECEAFGQAVTDPNALVPLCFCDCLYTTTTTTT